MKFIIRLFLICLQLSVSALVVSANDEFSKIQGTIFLSDGVSPVEGIDVRAFVLSYGDGSESWHWEWASEVITDANGEYDLVGLMPGIYRLGFYDVRQFSVYPDQFYMDATDTLSAADITVGGSELILSSSVTLRGPATISGTVTRSGVGTPLENINVSVYRWNSEFSFWDYLTGVGTNMDGSYQIGSLQAGTFRVRFWDIENALYETEFYDNASTLETATDLILAAAEDKTNINASLSPIPYSYISGVVTGSDSATPLSGIHVDVYQWDSDWSEWLNVTGYPEVQTGASGEFTTNRLPSGTYRAKFTDFGDTYVTEYFDNQVSIEQASDIVLQPNESVTDINASLSVYSWISGEVSTVSLGVPQFSSTEANVSLSWNSQLDAGYLIEFSADLENWEETGDLVRGTGDTMTFEHTHSVSESRIGFYRLVSESALRFLYATV